MDFSKITSIFKTKSASATRPLEQQISAAPTQSTDARRTNETYQQWGTRMCARATGDLTALTPTLQCAYHGIYQEQAGDEQRQANYRRQIEGDIERKNNDVDSKKSDIERHQKDISDINKSIQDKKAQIIEIKNSQAEVNKMEKLKFWTGISIIVPLTLYLFIFYSSTFYSAFFRDTVNAKGGVGNAMFDPNALSNAWEAGFFELLFVLFAPVIFLALGFILHFFSVQNGWGKYVKMGAIVAVTLFFDCILAYKIGEQLHNYNVIIGTEKIGSTYGISEAIHDINSWAVIFCGFIAYIIWGAMFDMVLTAYDKMDLNRTRIQNLNAAIEDLNGDKTQAQADINNLNTEIAQLNNDIIALNSKLRMSNVIIDYGVIKKALSEFFAGWIIQMKVLTCTQENMDQATNTYNNFVNSLPVSNGAVNGQSVASTNGSN